MKNANLILSSALLALGVAGTAPAHAQQAASSDNGYRMPYEKAFWGYTGLSVGRARYKDVCLGTFSCEDHDTGYKLYAGGKIHEALGFEVGYADLGHAKVAGHDVKAQGLNLSLLLGAPIGDRSSVFAKLGTTYGWTQTEGGPPGFRQGDENGWGGTWGVGTAIGINDQWQLRVDWDRTRFDFVRGDNRDIDFFSAGLQYRF